MTAHKDMTGADLHEPKGVAEATSGQVYVADGSGSGSWTTQQSQVPVGSVTDYAGTSAPSGWLFCYGQAISRTTYATLYAALSTTYGVGDGSTTFNLPDLRGRVTAGKDNMGGVSADRLTNLTNGVDGDTLGDTGGLESLTIAQANLPNVNLSSASLSATTTLTNRTNVLRNPNTNNVNISGAGTDVRIDGTEDDISASTSISGTVPLGGSGTALGHIQPTIILNKIIYTGV
jgi:microcystin-dependent protein